MPQKGLPQFLQSMSISSSPLLFIVRSFPAIVSAATATFQWTIQLGGSLEVEKNYFQCEIKDTERLKFIKQTNERKHFILSILMKDLQDIGSRLCQGFLCSVIMLGLK